MPNYVQFQVKSSGQWLNILGESAPSGTIACQGANPTTSNYLWSIIDTGGGWCTFQVKDTGLYLNIPSGNNDNSSPACQSPLPNPITSKFLWKILPPDNDGWSKIQVKSSSQYLNILNGGDGVGQPACQGDTPTTSNFLWMRYGASPKPVTVTLNLKNCDGIFNLGNGTTVTSLNERNAGSYLSLTDDNNGHLEDPNDINSFETLLNPGSQVTWQPVIESGNNNSGYTAAITHITFEQGTGNNVLGAVANSGPSGSANAQVFYTAIHPDNGDNEAYSITFTLTNSNGVSHSYIFDPKIKINPSN